MTATACVPPTALAALLAPSVRAAAPDIDRAGDIPGDLLARLRDAGAFRLLTPRDLGGHESSLATLLTVYEDFGRIDPAVAWLVCHANLGFIGALLDEAGRDLVWRPTEPDPIFANSDAPGTATRVDGGYLLSGQWKAVPGADRADWLVVAGSGAALRSGPRTRLFVVARHRFTVRRPWRDEGMHGTGAVDVHVANAFVPNELTVRRIAPADSDLPALVLPGRLAVILGIARAAIDEIVMTRRDGHARSVVAKSETALHGVRMQLFGAARELDAAAERRVVCAVQQRVTMRSTISQCAHVCRQVLDAMYELGESAGAGNPVERHFRDGMVALRHAGHWSALLEAHGRIAFGATLS